MSITVLTDQQRERRRKQWEAMLEKYEKRGQLNTADCSFSEVNYKLFVKPKPNKKFKIRRGKNKKIKKAIVKYSSSDIYHKNDVKQDTELDVLKDIDVSEIIDEDNVDISGEKLTTLYTFQESFSSNTEMRDSGVVEDGCVEEILKDTSDVSFSKISDNSCNISTKTYNSIANNKTVQRNENNNLFELRKYIEIDLNSNLKEAITNKSISQLLETDDCDYWHNCIKQEMTRLLKYIPQIVLKEYMGYCYKGRIPKCVNGNMLKDLMVHKMNSNLQELFIKRECMRHKKNKYLKYRKLVQTEWQRLCNDIPIDYLLVYGYSILFSIEKLKDRKISVIDSS